MTEKRLVDEEKWYFRCSVHELHVVNIALFKVACSISRSALRRRGLAKFDVGKHCAAKVHDVGYDDNICQHVPALLQSWFRDC